MNRLLLGVLLGTAVVSAIVLTQPASSGKHAAVAEQTVLPSVTRARPTAASSPAAPASSSLSSPAAPASSSLRSPAAPGSSSSSSPPSADVGAVTTAVAAAHGADVGIVVFDHQSGQTVLAHNADMQFSTASLVKLLIAVDLLYQRDGALDATESTQVRTMLSASDDDIADRLWDEDGGPDIVTRAAELMGLTSTVAPANPEQWGDTTTTASDITKVYRYLLDRAPASYRNVIMQALRDSTPLGTDGFNQRFGIPSAVGDRPWAVKQGWSCCTQPSPVPNGVVLHTTGTVDPHDRYIVVVLTDHDTSTTWSTATQRTTDVVRALLPNLPE